jgi:hypothetical protein
MIHCINQSFQAGLNYGNKNSSCTFSNAELVESYAGAVTVSVGLAMAIKEVANRSLGQKFVNSATGFKLLMLNILINGLATSTANFFNAYHMRKTERQKGISVFSDEKLTQQIGISRIAAK